MTEQAKFTICPKCKERIDFYDSDLKYMEKSFGAAYKGIELFSRHYYLEHCGMELTMTIGLISRDKQGNVWTKQGCPI